jgi:hypothetical protein
MIKYDIAPQMSLCFLPNTPVRIAISVALLFGKINKKFFSQLSILAIEALGNLQ